VLYSYVSVVLCVCVSGIFLFLSVCHFFGLWTLPELSKTELGDRSHRAGLLTSSYRQVDHKVDVSVGSQLACVTPTQLELLKLSLL